MQAGSKSQASPCAPRWCEEAPHPGSKLDLPPLPIGSADSADAKREKRSQRLGEITQLGGQKSGQSKTEVIHNYALSLGASNIAS
jgi:hypothetical protein